MTFVRKDLGDVPEDPDSVLGLREADEPAPARIDTWARASIPVQAPDAEYINEKETEAKRRQRATRFIEEKTMKSEVYSRPMTSTKRTSGLATARMTATLSARDSAGRTSLAGTDKKKEEKKYWKLESTEKRDLEKWQLDNEMREKKAFEFKAARELDRRKKADRDQTELEEKNRQKYQYELKNKPYTYDVKGKIIFLTKEAASRLPDVPVPKSQWTEEEKNALSPYYEHFAPLKDAAAIASECEKRYKEFRTGEIPENLTITIADASRLIKVRFDISIVNSQQTESQSWKTARRPSVPGLLIARCREKSTRRC